MIEQIYRTKCAKCGATGPECCGVEPAAEHALQRGWHKQNGVEHLCPTCAGGHPSAANEAASVREQAFARFDLDITVGVVVCCTIDRARRTYDYEGHWEIIEYGVEQIIVNGAEHDELDAPFVLRRALADAISAEVDLLGPDDMEDE
jgi:hypothetical protein